MNSTRQVQVPISNLSLPTLRHWGPYVAYFSNWKTTVFVRPGGIRGGGKVCYIPIGVQPQGGGAADRVFCGVLQGQTDMGGV